MKTAVVTGAAGGMGRAICQRLCEDGMRVIGLDLSAEGLAEMASALGPSFSHETVDLTQAGEVARAFADINAAFGGLDALVNNAGTCFMSDFPDIPADELDRQMAINFSSAFHCCQQAVPLMLARDGIRKIVNISSNGAYNFDPPGSGAISSCRRQDGLSSRRYSKSTSELVLKLVLKMRLKRSPLSETAPSKFI